MGSFVEARDLLLAAREHFDDEFVLHFNIAQVHINLNELDKALVAATRAHQIGPVTNELLETLAEINQRLGQHHEATKYWARLLHEVPGHERAVVNLGASALECGRLHEFAPFFREAVVMPGTASDNARLWLYFIALKSIRWHEAWQHFRILKATGGEHLEQARQLFRRFRRENLIYILPAVLLIWLILTLFLLLPSFLLG
ncbi:MAG: hypothetical protein JJU11_12560 [Candidatus Sumerlaeia bacterium]|nr:hypothetical protein [Candidatus Sumerlaeia bacterium]